MKQQYGDDRSPIIEVAVIDDMRARAKTLLGALEPYQRSLREHVPHDLRNQAYALVRDAEQRIARGLGGRQGERWYDAVPLPRNIYHYRTQSLWTGGEDGTLYLTYDSCLIPEVSEVIWDPTDWYCWSPSSGVKRDMVTCYGVPGIVRELAHGTVLDDMADRPLSYDELWDLSQRCREESDPNYGNKLEDLYLSRDGYSDEEFYEWNPKWRRWDWEAEQERVHEEWLEHLELLQLEAKERVPNDIYLD